MPGCRSPPGVHIPGTEKVQQDRDKAKGIHRDTGKFDDLPEGRICKRLHVKV